MRDVEEKEERGSPNGDAGFGCCLGAAVGGGTGGREGELCAGERSSAVDRGSRLLPNICSHVNSAAIL
jgi:hypothetical protein